MECAQVDAGWRQGNWKFCPPHKNAGRKGRRFVQGPAARSRWRTSSIVLSRSRHGGNYLPIAAVTLAAYPILFVTVFTMQGF